MSVRNDIFIVGLNITKAEASSLARNSADIVRVAHGVYFKANADAGKIFNEYGLRLANYFFKNAALSYSTAWYKRPVSGRIFIGGDYPYKKNIGSDDDGFCIVQSKTCPLLTDKRLYEILQIQDGFGAAQKFEMFCSTLELALLEVMEAPKKNSEKRLNEVELEKMFRVLIKKHGSKAALLTYLEDISAIVDRQNDFERLIKHLFLQRNR